MFLSWKVCKLFPVPIINGKSFFFMIFIEKHITFYVAKCVFWVSSRNSGGECTYQRCFKCKQSKVLESNCN